MTIIAWPSLRAERGTNFSGEKLNVFCATQRVNYKDVIHNLFKHLSRELRNTSFLAMTKISKHLIF